MPAVRMLLAALLLGVLLPTFVLASGYYDRVRKGDSIESVARRNQVTVEQLLQANRLSRQARLAEGSMLYVPRARPGTTAQGTPPRNSPAPPRSGATAPAPSGQSGWYVVASGDSLTTVARRFNVSIADLARENGISTNAMLKIGQKLRIPGAAGSSSPRPGGGGGSTGNPPQSSPPPASRPPDVADVPGGGISTRPSRAGYIWPLEGRVTRRFANSSSEKHLGVNIAAPLGAEIRAARDGTVVYASDLIAPYGKMVIIQHDGEMATCYAQVRQIMVRKDQRVRQGQVVATVGDSGRGGEPALHFEVRRNGNAVDPERYLP